MIKITYIFHDCFLLETDNFNIVFDYWKDPDYYNQGELPVFLENISRSKPLFILVSHHHKDHFSKEIFNWSKFIPNIHFVISKDVYRSAGYIFRENSLYKGHKISPSLVSAIKPGESFQIPNLKITAFASTDIGNSYLLECDNYKIFHAGDLNAWIWKDESTEHEVKKAIDDFNQILDSIYRQTDKIDYAFFPVDSRIGTDYWTGAQIFVNRFIVSHFFPMHFELADSGQDLSARKRDARAFEQYANPSRGEYIALQTPYSSFFSGE